MAQPLTRRASVTVAAAALVTLLGFAAPAAAQDPPDLDHDGRVSRADLEVYPPAGELGQAPSSGPATMALPMQGNPNNCVAHTEYPHFSSGDASVHAWTRCDITTPSIYVKTHLYRVDWWGLNSMAEKPAGPVVNKKFIEAVARSSCDGAPSRTYEAHSYHEATIGGNVYYLNTANSRAFTCA